MRDSPLRSSALLVVVASLIGCGDSLGPADPCAAHPGYGLSVSATSAITGDSIRGFSAWVVSTLDDDGDGSNPADSLATTGATATGVTEAGDYFVYVQASAYELWREYVFIAPGECGVVPVALAATLMPLPVPTSVTLEPSTLEVEAGLPVELALTVREDDRVVDVPVEWLVRDSAVAEVFGYESSTFPVPPLVYGSAPGETWVVVRSGSLSDSVRVVVTPMRPLDTGEALIETSGPWPRRYRVPMEANFSDPILDPREVGELGFWGWNPAWESTQRDGFGEAAVMYLFNDSVAVGELDLGWSEPDDAGTMTTFQPTRETPRFAVVYVQAQASRSGVYGPWGPNSRVYRSEARSTVSFDSVRVRPEASPVVFGTIAMDSAREYTIGNWDIYSYLVETGRSRDVGVTFATEIAIRPVSGAVIEVLEGPVPLSSPDREAYLFSQSDSLRANFFFSDYDRDVDIWLQVHHEDWSVGTYQLGPGTGSRVVGRWGVWDDPDRLAFEAGSGTMEVTARRAAERGYPDLLWGTLEIRGPLNDTAGVVVDTLKARIRFGLSGELKHQFLRGR